MSKLLFSKYDKVLCKNFNREILYNLYIRDNTLSINVDDIVKKENTTSYINESKIRYRAEKLILLNLLMDKDLENQIELRKNSKYDYLIGLLLFITSNQHFKYGYGYFCESIISFDKFLKDWCNFLNAIIADINVLPTIQVPSNITISYEEVIEITISNGYVVSVKIDLNNFDKLFRQRSKNYNFSLIIDKVIYEATVSDGSGYNSNLYKKYIELDNFFDTNYLKYSLLVNSYHEN